MLEEGESLRLLLLLNLSLSNNTQITSIFNLFFQYTEVNALLKTIFLFTTAAVDKVKMQILAYSESPLIKLSINLQKLFELFWTNWYILPSSVVKKNSSFLVHFLLNLAKIRIIPNTVLNTLLLYEYVL